MKKKAKSPAKKKPKTPAKKKVAKSVKKAAKKKSAKKAAKEFVQPAWAKKSTAKKSPSKSKKKTKPTPLQQNLGPEQMVWVRNSDDRIMKQTVSGLVETSETFATKYLFGYEYEASKTVKASGFTFYSVRKKLPPEEPPMGFMG